MELFYKLSGFKHMAPFGSRVVGCATNKSDYDFLVLVKDRPNFIEMEGSGFTPDSGDPLYGHYFSSWKNGKINLVFTDDEDYYKATLEACEFCRKYKVYDKKDRCDVHAKFREASVRHEELIF